ncbi:MAG: hypothetical protein HUJ75_03105, partial [Parasporobacterium sp.]|nr:hypothetical protein [Parasporobacterium sp.]
LKSSAEKMISQGIPVIFSIGPDFPITLLSASLDLYSKTYEGSFNKTSKARKHFMMLTGFQGEMASVSSWGRKYYIKWDEFEKIACTRSRFLTSILLIQKKK